VSAAINIDLDKQILPRNFVASLAQSSPGGPRPKRGELFRAEPDLAFFPMASAAHLERQRCNVAFFAETDLSACGFTCQITLLDNVAPRALQSIRLPPKQKLAFNFLIVLCPTVLLHKINMLNAMKLVSRKRQRKNSGVTHYPQSVAEPKDTLLNRHYRCRLYTMHAQTGMCCKNSLSAPAAAKTGHAEVATMIAKSSASIANSTPFSLAK
jgi:hypothetical protein